MTAVRPIFRLLVWRHVIGDWPRAALTIVGVALGVAVYVAVATANVEILRSFEQAILGVAGRATLQVSSHAGMAGGFDETIIAVVSHADGVIVATPVIEVSVIWHQTISAEGGRGVVLPILGVDLLAESSVRDYHVIGADETETNVAGGGWERYLDPDAIFLGRRLAERYGLSVGMGLDVSAEGLSRRLVVRGLLEGQGPGQSTLEELAVMDIAAAQVTFNRLGRLDRIDLVTDQTRSVDDVRRAIQVFLPPGLTITRPDQRNAQIERMTSAFRLNVSLLSVVALLVGLFLVYNTVSFAVLRRRREIGILRTLGFSPGGIAWLLLAEVSLIGLVGAVAGIGMGLALSNGVLQTLARTVSNLYGEVPAFSAVTWAHPAVLTQGLVIGLGVALLGALGPIREALSVAPTHALAPKGYEITLSLALPPRGGGLGGGGIVPTVAVSALIFTCAGLAALPDPVQGVPMFGYLSAFLVLLGFAWLSPVLVQLIGPCLRLVLPRRAGCLARLAADEVTRAPIRNAVAVSSLMVGLALMIGVSAMIHSFRQTVDIWLEQTVKADLIVAPLTWLSTGSVGDLSESMRERLKAIPDVMAVDSYRDIRMTFRDTPVVVVARDLLLHATHSRYLFMEGDSHAILIDTVKNNQILISETFARQFKFSKGDRMTLSSPQGPVEFIISGRFYDYSTDGGKVVMDHAFYSRLWGDRNATVLPVYLAPGADQEKVRRDLLERLHGEPPVMILTNGELKREVLRIFDQTFTITYALEVIAVIVALLGIVNALLSGILERQRELAVLRAIGGTPAQVGRLILWESGLLGIVGVILGLGAGLALSVLLIEVINKQSFGWTIVWSPAPWTWLAAAAVALLTTLVAGYGPARRAARLPVAEGLRYE